MFIYVFKNYSLFFILILHIILSQFLVILISKLVKFQHIEQYLELFFYHQYKSSFLNKFEELLNKT